MTDDDELPNEREPIGDNAADPKSIRRKKLRVKESARLRRGWWHVALSDEAGRREIWAMLIRAGTFDNPFQCGPNGFPQDSATFFALGAKSWGMELYHALIRFDPALVLLMHTENDKRSSPMDI